MDLSRLTDEQLQAMLDAQASSAAGPQLDHALSAIHQIESSGAPDARADIVNPVSGARGSMQVMPDTARDPGFGVRPSSGTSQDSARMGRDYYRAMLSRYGLPELAAIAYNWGPGNADRWIEQGADVTKLPTETLEYLVKFDDLMEGSQNKSLYFPGISDIAFPEVPAEPHDTGSGEELESAAPGHVTTTTNPLMMGSRDTLAGLLNMSMGWLGKGANLIAPDSQFAHDVAQGRRDLAATSRVQERAYQAVPHSFAGDAARFGAHLAGTMAVSPMTGGGLGSMLTQGAAIGALQSPDSPWLGAGMGAGGAAAGSALLAGASAARPALSRAWHAALGGEHAATARIADELGATTDQTIDALRANSDEIIPKSRPTSAEASQSPELVRLQREMQNTAEGQVAFPTRQAERNAARFAEGERVVGANLSGEVDAFTQAQAARVAAGQAELPPLTQAQAEVMQSPAYRQALKSARASAENRGSGVFEDQQVPIMQSLREGIERVAGTPETIDALKAARGQTADELFAQADVSVPLEWTEAQTLAHKPAFQDAIRFAQRMSDNLGEGPIASVEEDGAGTWLSGHGLLYAKGYLDDQINYALQRERNTEARALIAVKNELVGLMDRASPEYAPARARFQAESAPIDAQQALQARLNGTVDPMTGVVNPNKLRQTINSVTAEQLKPGIRPADRVSPAMLDQLRGLGQQAHAAPGDLTGLRGEGQEYMRQALAERVRNSADTLMRQDANSAAANFSSYLRTQSPSYARYFDEAATTGADLQSRQALHEALQKLGWAAHNAFGDAQMTFQGAKAVLPNAAELTGASNQYVRALIADLQRETAVNAQLSAAGSPTMGNLQLGGGLLGRLIRSRATDATITGAAFSGNLPEAAALYMVQRAVARAAARTEKATIDLLLNPKKLARALEEFKGEPTARKAFIDALKHKANGAGRAGTRAVQAFEARQDRKKRGQHG